MVMNCMKVLTIKQPYASAVVYGYKEFEFRSWKTNYRGKILIHAGMTKDNDSITKFEKYHLDYNFGMIIGEVDLLDCILVDEVLDKSLRKKDGIVYEHNHIGKYAWKFSNPIIYSHPIKIKGKLGLWNYYKN